MEKTEKTQDAIFSNTANQLRALVDEGALDSIKEKQKEIALKVRSIKDKEADKEL